MWIRRNYKDLKEFNNQAAMLIERFIAKSFRADMLRDIKKDIEILDREVLLKDKPKKEADFGSVFITDYSKQSKQFKE